MVPKSISTSLVAVSLLLSLASCTALNTPVIRPPAPKLLPATQNPAAPTQESSISVPVHVDLSPFLAAANDDSVIPKKIDHWGSSIKHPKGAEYKFYAERDSFTMAPVGVQQANDSPSGAALREWWKGIELSSSHVFVGTALRYKIGAPSFHCGEGSDWPRRATAHGSIAAELTPTYGLSASVASVAVNPSDPCQLRVGDLDVAQEVRQRLADLVRGGLSRAVTRVNTLTVRSHMETAWNTLRNPIKLEPDAWLQFNIEKVRHSGFSGVGPIVNDTIHITANPVIVFGHEPPTEVAALPPLDSPPTSTGFHGTADTQLYSTLPTTLANRLTPTGFHVITDVPLDYASLSKGLANRLTGKRVAKKGSFVLITNASIFGNGGNQVVIRIDFSGDAVGHVYFVGKPEMSSLTQTVSLGGLRYDLETEALVQTTAAWLDLPTLRDLVASESILGVTPATDRVRGLLATTMNRALSPSVAMHGTVESVQGIGVFADVNALHIRTMSDGTLGLTVAEKP
jgi:hypothetical protein